MLSLLELELCTDLKCAKTEHLMFSFNDFCIYLHICSLFVNPFAIHCIEAINLRRLHCYPIYIVELLSGQFSKSLGWPLNRDPIVQARKICKISQCKNIIPTETLKTEKSHS